MASSSNDSLRNWSAASFHRYIERYPQDADRLGDLRQLLASPPGPLDDRKTMPGHLTASGIVFDPNDHFVLLLHHKSLDRWLQPGGHLDAGELPIEAARREVREETGVVVGQVSSPVAGREEPVDIDSHAIPANAKKGEEGHTHHDFRFAFAVNRSKQPLNLAVDEVVDAAWMPVSDPRFPADLRRCVERVFDRELFSV